MPARTRERRQAIVEVVAGRAVKSQEELALLLAEQGLSTTQPMLSRDLRALNVVKRDGVYEVLEEERITPLESLAGLLRGAQAVGPHLVVVNCEPGAASAVARALEAEALAGVAGTVAGDDTLFVAVTSARAGSGVARRVRSLLQEDRKD